MDADMDKFLKVLLAAGRQSEDGAQQLAMMASGVVLGFALACWIFRGNCCGSCAGD